LARILRDVQFHLITIYEEFGDAESKIVDPVMISDCGLKNRVLLTGDKDLIYTWAKEIAEARIAVFVTTDNNEGPKQWGPRIISAKDDILRELRRREGPLLPGFRERVKLPRSGYTRAQNGKRSQLGRKIRPTSTVRSRLLHLGVDSLHAQRRTCFQSDILVWSTKRAIFPFGPTAHSSPFAYARALKLSWLTGDQRP
jgi:hypothetical protein